MTRYGGLGQSQYRHQVADTELPIGLQQQDDAQTERVGKCFDGLGEMFHG